MYSLSRKRFLSTSDVMTDCLNEKITPIKSPKELMCIPHNTPEESPRLQGDVSSSISSLKSQGVVNEFHKQLLKALFKKIPDKINSKPEVLSSWIPGTNDVPIITISSNIDSPVSKHTELSIANVESCNSSHSKGVSDVDQNNSFSDRLSTTATCASGRSSPFCFSDADASFSDDDVDERVYSSLDDIDYPKHSGCLDFSIKHESVKKSSSMHNLLDNSKYMDF